MSREQQILDMIRDTIAGFADELQGYTVFLFGSRAAGTMRERSDFDIGVLGAGPLPVGLFSRIADRFGELPTLYRIDWVDLATVSDRFRAEALRTKVVIHGGVGHSAESGGGVAGRAGGALCGLLVPWSLVGSPSSVVVVRPDYVC